MDVSFEEENKYAPASSVEQKNGLLTLVMRLGLASNERQAGQVLIGTIVVCLAVIVGIWVFGPDRQDGPSPLEVQQLQQAGGAR